MNPHQRNVTKLRTTGFEDLPIFVIRLSPAGLCPSALGPAIDGQACLGISFKFDEFPN